MDDFERELKEDFLEESLQLLEDSEQAFLALENSKDDTELMDQIFRLAHNLKGTSRAVGFGDVAEFTHEMENLILKLKQGEMEITDSMVTLLLECNDHITNMINALREDIDASFNSDEIVAQIQKALAGELVSEPSTENTEQSDDWGEEKQELTADEYPSADAFEEEVVEETTTVVSSNESDTEISAAALEALKELGGCDPAMLAELEGKTGSSDDSDTEISAAALEALKELGGCDPAMLAELEGKTTPAVGKADDVLAFKKGDEELPVAKPVAAVQEAVPINKPAAKAKPTAKKGNEDESIRVSLSRVEKLNNFVGELVILQTVLDQRRYTAITDELSNKSIGQLAKLSKEIQEISMSLRMIPIKTTLQKMTRIIRDTSKTLDKQVNLTLKGEETEIDKTVLEHLADPLVHIVRNAVDHGLEDTKGRIQAGKSEAGEVGISAFHEGNNLVIEISDDGNGIDPEVIKKIAIEKGVIKPSQTLSDTEAVNLIFHPGFSTKAEVTEVSGRGVGMDVVKTNIEKLSGTVQVTSVMGKGSIFKVVLPLTLAIIDGMIVRIGEEKYIIPLNQVHESIRPTPEIVNEVTGMGEVLNLRGEVLPLFDIAKTLNRKGDNESDNDKIAIIVHTDKFNFAVRVDDILHQQQVVIKNLGDEIKVKKGFMGSSILGDGKPSFILDLNELFSGQMKKQDSSYASTIREVA